MKATRARCWLLVGGIVALWLLSGCAVTAKDIHAWGRKGDYPRIQQELRQNPNEEIREAAAMELGRGNRPWAIPDLVALSVDPSPRVRLAAVQALGSYAGAEAYNAIIQRTGDDNAEVARAAESILRTWGSESSTFLIEALSDRNYKVRLAAVKVLSRMTGSDIGPALMEAAQRDENSLVRAEAAKGLGLIGYAPAKRVLFKLKNTDPSKEVAMEAERALGKIGGNVFDFTLLVLPLKAGSDAERKGAETVVARVTASLLTHKVCDVQPGRPDFAYGDDLQASALAEAKASGAGQALYGAVAATGNRLTFTLFRADARSGKLIQQVSGVGYAAEAEKAAKELADNLITRME